MFNFAGAILQKFDIQLNYWRKWPLTLGWFKSYIYPCVLFWLFLASFGYFSDICHTSCHWYVLENPNQQQSHTSHFVLISKEYVHHIKYFCICINVKAKSNFNLQTRTKGDYELLRKRAWVWNARAILPTKMGNTNWQLSITTVFYNNVLQQQHIRLWSSRWIWEGWWIPCEKRQRLVWNKRTRMYWWSNTSAQCHFNWIRQLSDAKILDLLLSKSLCKYHLTLRLRRWDKRHL